ncbi:MAG: KamA family radical SAM protein [Gemmatimonadota bacterium]|nr:KamA family radical SAM protein [Gemmatimonadota bacterium]
MNNNHMTDRQFWRAVPAWSDVSLQEFASPIWQERNSASRPQELISLVDQIADPNLVEDILEGFRTSSMSVRVPPYILALIDWERPHQDPLRKQYVPLGSEVEPDHPMMQLDSLNERNDSPVEGLVHRYRDKALFLALGVCPVYCRYCTRSYAVGMDTEELKKPKLSARPSRWEPALEYISGRREIRDIVVSGGDIYRLKSRQIEYLCNRLLEIPHIRRIRLATKGLAVLPMRIIGDGEWSQTLVEVSRKGRRLGKEVCLHTHFNHPREITGFTAQAAGFLFENGITVRNQSVLVRGVNDSFQTMSLLIDMLSDLQIHPYYVYLCDQVSGTEHLRVPLRTAIDLEKRLRGWTAGYNTPLWVVDTTGGGGKRDIHSYEKYDPDTGIAVYSSPTVRPGDLFFHYDPLSSLGSSNSRLWNSPDWREDAIARHRHIPFNRIVTDETCPKTSAAEW